MFTKNKTKESILECNSCAGVYTLFTYHTVEPCSAQVFLRGGDIHVYRYVKINLDKTCKVGFNNGIDQTYESIEIKVPETQQKDVERVAKFDIME